MLPERSVLIGQKLVENAKIQKFKCDILSNFQTMCRVLNLILLPYKPDGVFRVLYESQNHDKKTFQFSTLRCINSIMDQKLFKVE